MSISNYLAKKTKAGIELEPEREIKREIKEKKEEEKFFANIDSKWSKHDQ